MLGVVIPETIAATATELVTDPIRFVIVTE
jgi:hypothetical protein